MSEHAILCQLAAIRQRVVWLDHTNYGTIDEFVELRDAAQQLHVALERAISRAWLRKHAHTSPRGGVAS
jgi:hypothetical protein